MMALAIIFSLFSALFNASASVLERLGTTKSKSRKGLAFKNAVSIFFNKLFLIGILLQISGFVMQALALARSPLVIVEPLLTTDLVFLLIIIRLRLKVEVGLKEWIAALGMSIGLSGLFLSADPHGGHLKYAFFPWLILILAMSIVISLVFIANRYIDSINLRTFLSAIAASLSFAANAAFTKLLVNDIKNYGFILSFSHWPIYALIISGLISLYLMQNAYSMGPLAIAQPTTEVIEPTISVIIGMMIFGDMIRHNLDYLIIEFLCIGLIIWGIIVLSTSKKIHQAGNQGI